MQNRLFAVIAILATVGLIVCAGEKKPPKPTSINAEMEVKHRGTIWFMLYPDKAPNCVNQFVKLSKEGFYDGLRFWRISQLKPGQEFVQSGCPNNDGTGYYIDKKTRRAILIKEEIDTTLHHKRGTLSMMDFGKPVTTSSQFLICRSDIPEFDGRFTIIGEVVQGLGVLDSIQKNDTIAFVRIKESYQ